MTILKVGGIPVAFNQAQEWTAEYLTAGTYSYPAYDAYEGSGLENPYLGDADLLAPVLLNVSRRPVPAYYSLQALVPVLNPLLETVPTGVSLADATEADLDAVAALFSALDADPKPAYVKMTTLAKVLARKRPGLIPVYDDAVRHCYTACDGAPVPEVSGRTWAGYARAWVAAVRDDLLYDHYAWAALAALAPADQVQISPLRALDIVAWRAGLEALPPQRGRRSAEADPI